MLPRFTFVWPFAILTVFIVCQEIVGIQSEGQSLQEHLSGIDILPAMKSGGEKQVYRNKQLLHNTDKILKSKGYSQQKFEEHETVIPIRIHHKTGKPISHGHHFRSRNKDKTVLKKRKKRQSAEEEKTDLTFNERINRGYNNNSLNLKSNQSKVNTDYVEDDSTDFFPHNVVNYSISGFGEQFLLHLTPYDNFVGPNYSLRYLSNSTENKIHPDVPRHCFYVGHVNNNEEHRVVLSICHGMFGAFRTDNDDYLIEPDNAVFRPSTSDNDYHGTKPHRLSKRSKRATESRGRLMCGYIESPNDDLKRHDHDEPQDLLYNEPTPDLIVPNLQDIRANGGDFLYKDHVTPSRNNMNPVTLDTPTQHHGKSPHPIQSSAFAEVNSDKLLSRRKRHLSLPRNLEVMVTVDNILYNTREDIEHYVLSLMAIVHQIFLDPSIENLINIVIVELVVIDDSQVENGPKVVRNAHSCLKNFCQWQHGQNNPDDTHPTHHDTAVLITGQDICRSETACDTLGLAELGTVCDFKRSCSISEDNGLSTGFTIAHEIGHLFDAPHDSSDKCLDNANPEPEMNVMSPTLDYNAHPWSWSSCSAKFITKFLDNRNGECLLDSPPLRLLSLPIEEPGEVFNANDQCQFIYGNGTNHCNFMLSNTCKRLWCVSTEVLHGCRTPHLPWADGTKCGHKMWCQKGECVPENRDRLPTDGGWGTWSRFGECSRTCGGGVKVAERQCDNPRPEYGGFFCTGRRRKFRSCNSQECSSGGHFRAEQCASFNNWSRFRRIRIQGVPSGAQWVPKYDGISQKDHCKLTCQVKSNGRLLPFWYVLKSRVIDGTPCSPESHDICVEGICRKAGCDHVIDSSAVEDICGLCRGDNSSCRQVHGKYNSGYTIGYNKVTVIPAGATSVVITQKSHTGDSKDDNYLALREKRGYYILNGHRSVMKRKQTLRQRTTNKSGRYLYNCDYTGTDVITEVINCTLATQVDLVVEVLTAGNLMPPDIDYQYYLPLSNDEIYRWRALGPWTSCSNVCQGKTKQKIYCVSNTNNIVSENKCLYLQKPNSIIKSCNTDCQLRWHAKPGKCSVRCGSGTMYRMFHCWKVAINGSEYSSNDNIEEHLLEQVNDTLCPYPKPSDVSTCKGECLPANWKYSPWSDCSVTCGNGIQNRTKTCRDSSGVKLDDNECQNENVRELLQECLRPFCPKWTTSTFSECSETCGSSFQVREVWCTDNDGHKRLDSDCTFAAKPVRITPCNDFACPVWEPGGWSACSATCGEGVSLRLYHCVNHNKATLHPSMCNATSLPERIRSCSAVQECIDRDLSRGEWRRFPFVVTRSMKKNIPFKHDVITNTHVNPTLTASTTTTPPSSERIEDNFVYPDLSQDLYSNVLIVNVRRAGAIWRTGSWTKCSATCGSGIKLRYVSCRHKINGKEVDKEICKLEKNKPSEQESCQIQSCHGAWRTGDWTSCSVSCGEGVRSRYVTCLFEGHYFDDDHDERCVVAEKPQRQEPCFIGPCTSQISSTTSSTVITTIITNSMSTDPKTNETKSEDINPTKNSPTNSTTSIMYGRWRIGRWSKCSTLCGKGIQNRAVLCRDDSGRSASCDTKSHPPKTRVCVTYNCAKWLVGQWGECSQSCGGGTRIRSILCIARNGTKTDERNCNGRRQPTYIKSCKLKNCRYHWWRGSWSSCSSTCGRGIKTRQVQCFDGSKIQAADEKCSSFNRPKPRTRRPCRIQRSCPKWKAGNWSECSSSCGPGNHSRIVKCRYKGKEIVDQLCDPAGRPEIVRSCNATQCPIYHWNASAWSECSSSCGDGRKTRQVTCSDGKNTVDSDLCVNLLPEPNTSASCSSRSCASFWLAGAWEECSLTCGSGMQQRKISCVYVDPVNYTYVRTDECDANNRPHDLRDCNRGSCGGPVFWRVGAWSECSASCGEGWSVRKVVCSSQQNHSAIPNSLCEATPSFRPEDRRFCLGPLCIPKTCKELQDQQNITGDGEFHLNVSGKMLKIYCKSMNTLLPREYLTLQNPEDNFSEIFGLRLINPVSCPNNGSRLLSCSCHRDHPDEGYTKFYKVRFDVRFMKLLGNDYSFAETNLGKPVAFGTAGDCYSRNNCPQGRFQINLEGTGLVVNSKTKWISYGINSSMQIRKLYNGKTIQGKCGGYCSRCQPDPKTELIVKHEAG